MVNQLTDDLLRAPDNDNNALQDWKRCKYLHEDWDQYEEIRMTIFGPIGVKGPHFYYLDPEIREWRG